MQVVEKIRSHSNTVKLTLISIKPISKEVQHLVEEENLEKNAFQFQERQVISPIEQNSQIKMVEKTAPIIVANNKSTSTAATQATPKSQKLRHRFFRLPDNNISKSDVSNLVDNDNAVNRAASKLTNLAKNSSANLPLLSYSFRGKNSFILPNSKNLFSKSKNLIFKSTSNINNDSAPIC